MNDEEINRAIAEHLGAVWIYEDSSFASWPKQLQPMLARFNDYAGDCEVNKGMVFSRIPDYCGDLNAMHEAEKTLENHQLWMVTTALAGIVLVDTPIAHATARQRAEAFLRVVGKWRGEEAKL
jgi:hypothetical protein